MEQLYISEKNQRGKGEGKEKRDTMQRTTLKRRIALEEGGAPQTK